MLAAGAKTNKLVSDFGAIVQQLHGPRLLQAEIKPPSEKSTEDVQLLGPGNAFLWMVAKSQRCRAA